MYRWRWSLYLYAEEEKVVIYAGGEGNFYICRWRRYMCMLRGRRLYMVRWRRRGYGQRRRELIRFIVQI